MNEPTLMASVHSTAIRLKEEGIGISERALRAWVEDGLLPCVQSGRNRLINWNTLMKFLEGQKIDKTPRPYFGRGSKGGKGR